MNVSSRSGEAEEANVMTSRTAVRILVITSVIGITIGLIVTLTHPVKAAGDQYNQWVDPANPSDQLVTGPYKVDPNWPKFPGPKGWTFGALQGVFAQNPDRIFVAMRGELPDLAGLQSQVVEAKVASGMTVHLQVPALFARDASTGEWGSPGESTDQYKGIQDKDYKWEHIITVYDSQGNVKEAWTQWDSLFGRPDPRVLSQGRVHKILISPYDPEKRVWAIDDGHQVIQIFSNDGKKLLQTIGTPDTTTPRNAVKTGLKGTPSLTKKSGPPEKTFGRQTDIAWLPDGTFFVADGYEETRVVKFDKNGNFLKAWGEPGECPETPVGDFRIHCNEKRPGYFNTVHGIVVDDQRRVYVDDRANRRIQIFDENGKFLSQWYLGDGPTLPYHLSITAEKPQHIWMSDGYGNFKFYKYDLNGRLLSTWGSLFAGPGGLWGVHQFSVDQNGNLYTAEVHHGLPQKFVPRKGAPPELLVGQEAHPAWQN
jgi:hypothetical protein